MGKAAGGRKLICLCLRKPQLLHLVTSYYCILLCLVKVLYPAVSLNTKPWKQGNFQIMSISNKEAFSPRNYPHSEFSLAPEPGFDS